jgi:hemerythrin
LETAPVTTGGGGDAGASTVETPVVTAPKSASEKYKLTVDGEDIELSLEDLKAGYSTNRASTRRFQQAAALEKQSKEVLKAIKEGDFDYLQKHLPKDKFLKAAEKALLEKIEFDELPDHEKELRKLRRELEDRDKSAADQQREREEQEYRQLVESATEEIDKEITEILSETKFRANPLVVSLMTNFMMAPLEAAAQEGDASVKRMSAKEAMGKTDAFLTAYMPDFLRSIPPDVAAKYIPKELFDHHRESEVKKITERLPTRRDVEATPARSSKQQGPRSIDQAFEEIEKKFAKRR